MLETNRRSRGWLKTNTQLRASSTLLSPELLAELEHLTSHLNSWMVVYSSIFLQDPRAALVYTADERHQGVGFPPNLERVLREEIERSCSG